MSRHSAMYSGMSSCSIDIDECETANGGCEQMCSNTIGSFACSCDVGYWLAENGLKCNGKQISECNCRNDHTCNIICFTYFVDQYITMQNESFCLASVSV